jgi:energy-coupling factor transport system ATP-binding protein
MSIEIKELTHIYSEGTPYEKKALDQVNIVIEKNEFIGLIGHTGSGKSTLIQHINGLLKPHSGTVFVDGIDIFHEDTKLTDVRKKVGLVFQYPEHQLFEMTVFEDVAFGPKNLGLEKEEVDKRVNKALEMVGVDKEIYKSSPFELSGGQKRRVAIAGVLAMEPDVLILDEPTAGLDPAGRDEILDEVKGLHENNEITIILVSHSMEDIANYVDRILVMDKGQVILEGDKYKVFKETKLLEEIGLGVPKVTKLADVLASKGFVFDREVTTIEEAVESILPQLQKEVAND